ARRAGDRARRRPRPRAHRKCRLAGDAARSRPDGRRRRSRPVEAPHNDENLARVRPHYIPGVLVALAGGVGAARFLAGLVRAVPPDEVVAIVNTGDDDEFHGLHVSPDLDSVTYTLAGASNAAQGWGLEGETFATLDALARYDVPTWFRLGDKDLATHLFRTQRLHAGATLSEVNAEITRAWGLELRIVPMTDDRVRTRITVTRAGGHTEEIA